ncbi:spermidine family transporter [Schizosaccharomyces cryophilus OY26]|uniref:Spermidine family transporter n=1 Tax=Schizosaccharomyces cryophilus (strain OY26 / ATCC MYA-4695 / CBS 11777 / NBRC 106824 / NRRL Y48691) TaxID=653667 RepID=S9VTM1_SCHCR|nr:spermidine family transporter [Schizosaccharomyces cryophilus OY26]EPY49499.1 spermidine family transporter [Schizosaccharomyces cryophilus OY26]
MSSQNTQSLDHSSIDLEKQSTQHSYEDAGTGLEKQNTRHTYDHRQVGSEADFNEYVKQYPVVNNPGDFIVTLNGPNDPDLAVNWRLATKLQNIAVMGCACLWVSFGSSSFSGAIPAVMVNYHVGKTVAILGISLYVLGFASGPLVWAPMSEAFGRRKPMIVAVLIFSIFQIAVATAKDIQTVMICRFFSGFFGSSPVTTVAGSFSDMFSARTRGLVIAAYAAIIFNGPLVSPIVGGFIGKSYLGWRWISYLTAILGFFSLICMLIFHRETYTKTITEERAKLVRKVTGNYCLHAKSEEEPLVLSYFIHKYLTLPLRLLLFEPILLIVSTYTAFVYGILYGLLEAYPVIFGEARGWSEGVMSLPYLAILVGVCIGSISVAFFQPYYFRQMEKNKGRPAPEARLPAMMLGCIVFPIGIFWLAWTVPTLSGSFVGFGIITIFQQSINYIVDCYSGVSASAIAANTLFRSSFGAAFPLFTTQMFNNLGIGWAGSLVGFVAVALIPFPFLLFFYGSKIRSMSKLCLKDSD